VSRKNKFNVGDLVVFPSFKPENDKYYYALIIDIIESDCYLDKVYKCIMDGETITLTKSTIKQL
tara:strand:+ start:1661 stop:1852 length:192 start_codon:yes stop_codon:yes gene_type:complete